jgi:opacity protein-like surface antigen
MKKLMTFAVAALISASAFADGQVFYRYGFSSLSDSRGNQTFTDTRNGLGAGASNNDKSGHGLGAGLDLSLMQCPLFANNSVAGEIFVDYNRFSKKIVPNAINVVVQNGLPQTAPISVSELAVVVAPKYRIGGLGKLRPWIIPIGLAFMVNNPPSNTTSYLDIGYQVGAGTEYELVKQLSVGVDYRYTVGSGDPGLKVKYGSIGTYLAINF